MLFEFMVFHFNFIVICYSLFFPVYVIDSYSTSKVNTKEEYVWLHPATLDDNADFGSSVAMNNKYIAIGAQNNNNDTGTVFIYSKEGTLLWEIESQQGNIIRSNDTIPVKNLSVGANFGCALAACDDTLFIGAQYNNNNRGSVYIVEFDVLNLDNLPQVRVMTPPKSLHTKSFFGGSLKIKCNQHSGQLIVGAAGGNGRGAVYISTRGKLRPNDWGEWKEFGNELRLQNGSNFGQAVDIVTEQYISVGANHADNTTGAVFLYDTMNTKIPFLEYARPPRIHEGSYFGSSLASNGKDIVACGAPWAYGGNGSVGIYTTMQKEMLYEITSPSSESGGNFGVALKFHGNLLFVGAWNSNNVFVYNITKSSSQQLKSISSPRAGQSIFFGSAIDVDDDSHHIVVGAFGDAQDEGAAYLFENLTIN